MISATQVTRKGKTQYVFDLRIKDGTGYGSTIKRVDASTLEGAWALLWKDVKSLTPFLVSVTLKEDMKLNAKARLLQSAPIDTNIKFGTKASLEDPLSDGTSFDMLVDGERSDVEPEVQELTHDDGGVETAPEKHLLVDDLVPS